MTHSTLKFFNAAEAEREGQRYRSPSGEWLFLYEHPVTNSLVGVREEDLGSLRHDFAKWLSEQLTDEIGQLLFRKEKLARTAGFLYELLRQSPPRHDWLCLPADTRIGLNRSTLAYHALLVSAFACAMARAWVEVGKSISDLLRFQVPAGEQEQPVDLEELICFIRVASLCHDFGKHPPQRHHERGREQVRKLFSGLMPELVVFSLSEVAYRRHTALSYRLREESHFGVLEEIIAHADTLASASERPVDENDRADPVESLRRFFRDELGGEEALSLISADTDRVKGYVFETARLAEVRGASALLTDLNEKQIAQMLLKQFTLPPECLLYAAGGSALIVAPTQLATRIAREIERLYLQRTKMATISVVHRPTMPREWVNGVEADEAHFGSVVKWIGYDLRRAKESRTFYPFFKAIPYARRCDSCEVRPVEQRAHGPDGRDLFLCSVCGRKRSFGQNKKSAYVQRFEEFLQRSWAKSPYAECLSKIAQTNEVRFAQDLQEIGAGAEGKARGYVGIIYTDGNDIGRRIERSRTPAEYRTLSEELRRVTQEATFKALAWRSLLKKVKCSDGEERWIHPFEIIVIGGDDVLLIVPGDVALEIALAICKEFEKEFHENLTMSAGVLIMPQHFPIYFAHTIAERLLKSAKKAGRKSRPSPNTPPPAYIDFQAITGDTSLGEDLEEYREQFYGVGGLLTQIERLTRRPYPLPKLRRLIETIRWAKSEGFPVSQLYQLRAAVVEHVSPWSRNWYRYQIARDEKEDPGRWRQFHKKLFGTEPLRDLDSPWQFEDGQWITPVVDLVEVFDYVREDKEGETSETGDRS